MCGVCLRRGCVWGVSEEGMCVGCLRRGCGEGMCVGCV